ncbi:peroxide stress protein YaaA [Sphingomonas jatrophae]|uniref:UPF0246 protein SAMN05192580_0350 n=1 Tax=Sphingomonas jatrophae TaxID=1166337 RepID=A0A1I6JJ92_9SPHN|nr:peroxide stress protein YaaA [Sphingomonas jatrophae]SFR79086.1 hypothetical protein SAMN05192580_0350 [Sphingomonas jatrophae]
MIALLSPAKTLDFTKPTPPHEPSEPRFAAEAETLAAAAAKLGPKKLGALMHISPKLATLNADRYKGFGEAEQRAALYAFNGDVYLGLEARSLDPHAIAFAQDHVRILSGLYGLLRPLDAIRPYRLEMGTPWAPGRAKDLYAWWGRRLSDALARELATEGTDTVINLASQEYWQAIGAHPPAGARILTIDFREEGPKGLRFNSFAAKRARGMMARYICEHRLTDAEALKGFDSDGYAFAGEDGDTWRFQRIAPPAKA